jgi:hypothetical protein
MCQDARYLDLDYSVLYSYSSHSSSYVTKGHILQSVVELVLVANDGCSGLCNFHDSMYVLLDEYVTETETVYCLSSTFVNGFTCD